MEVKAKTNDKCCIVWVEGKRYARVEGMSCRQEDERASSRLPEGTMVRHAVQPGRHGGVFVLQHGKTRERTHFKTLKASAGTATFTKGTEWADMEKQW